MFLERTERFKRAYKKLDEAKRGRVQKALQLLAENPRHPSLQVKRMQGTNGIWEARASLSLRITLEMDSETILLRNVGEHDETLKRP
jgi:mRNA-degrading endonuclease RelE of RelBE toxin-antitoxin system